MVDDREAVLHQRISEPIQQVTGAAPHQLRPRVLVGCGRGEHPPERLEAAIVRCDDIFAPCEYIDLCGADDTAVLIERWDVQHQEEVTGL